MPEWPDEVLAGLDGPRVLPSVLRRRLEDSLLGPAQPARALGDELSTRLEDELADPLFALFAEVDEPRAVPAGARRALTRSLVRPRAALLPRMAAAAAALVLLAGVGVGLAVSRGTGSGSSSSASQALRSPTLHGNSSPRVPGPSGPGPSGRSSAAAPSANGPAGTSPGLGSTGSALAGPDQPAQVPTAAPVLPVPLQVTSVSPASGPVAGGTWVTLTGTGFGSTDSVRFGSLSAMSLVVVSPTEIQAESPPEPLGVVDVVVSGTGGTSTTGPADRFTYTGG